MDMTQQEVFNLKLVKEVKKRPCLYKTDMPEHTRRSVTDDAWEEVGKILGWPGLKCKERFKNIRNVCARYKKALSSGVGVTKRPYYMLDHMKFIFPYIKSYTPDSKPGENQLPLNEEFNSGMTCNKEFALWEISTTSRGSHQSDEMKMDISTLAVNYSKDLQDDPRMMFLLSLLPDVCAMNDSQTRQFKLSVLQLVDDILSPKCKDKFKNIRIVCARYKRALDSGIRAKRRPYYLYEEMQFAFPYFKAKDNRIETQPAESDISTNKDGSDIEEYIENSENHIDMKFEGSSSPGKSSTSQTCDDSLDTYSVIEKYSTTSPLTTPHFVAVNDTSHQTPNHETGDLDFTDSSQNHSRASEPKRRKVDTPASLLNSSRDLIKDSKKMFLLSLIPDIYTMTDSQMRKFKRGVLQLVDDILK